jgi:hypothetical protein
MKAVLLFMNQKFSEETKEFFGNTSLEAYSKALEFITENKGVKGLRRVISLQLQEVTPV